MGFWFWLAFSLFTAAVNYALMPKIDNEPPPAADAPDVPFHDEGTEIPVVFGTVDLAPFVGWYDGFRYTEIRESTSKKG